MAEEIVRRREDRAADDMVIVGLVVAGAVAVAAIIGFNMLPGTQQELHRIRLAAVRRCSQLNPLNMPLRRRSLRTSTGNTENDDYPRRLAEPSPAETQGRTGCPP